jgi:hypothetical protein
MAQPSIGIRGQEQDSGQFGADGLAFAIGLVGWVEIRLLGRLYLGEVFLSLCSIAFPLLYVRLPSEREKRWIRIFFAGGLVYVGALCLADLYRHNAPADYLRGWARAVVLLTNVAGLLVLGYRRPERLMLFLAGSAGSQLVLSLWGARPSDWKFGIAYPLSVAVLLVLDSRRRVRAGLLLLGMAGLHLIMDYRSYAAFFLLAALALLARGPRGLHLRFGAVSFTGFVLLGFAALYSLTSQLNRFGTDLMIRRARSNAERAAGFVIGAQFVGASPLVGYGSWPRSDDALVTWAFLQSQVGRDEPPDQLIQHALDSHEGNIIRTHSMILQAWVEAGLAGLLFFTFSAVMMARLLARLAGSARLGRYHAAGFFFGLWGLWALVASPFAGESRLYTALSIVLLLVLTREQVGIERLSQVSPNPPT